MDKVEKLKERVEVLSGTVSELGFKTGELEKDFAKMEITLDNNAENLTKVTKTLSNMRTEGKVNRRWMAASMLLFSPIITVLLLAILTKIINKL